jgi:Uma2 family endonuclease
MSTAPSIPASAPQPSFREAPVPPLENGDHLTREEFERRYKATGEEIKAELIEGVVYMASPVSEYHSRPHFRVITLLGLYELSTPGLLGADNGTVKLDLDNMSQPDAHLRIAPECGGRARLDDEGYVVGAPELAVEVAYSSASYDLNVKLNAYRRNGVQEYLVWRTFDGAIDWFALRSGKYELLAVGADGVIRSEVFPGLWLHPSALINGDAQKLLAVAQQGIASPEHAEFVDRLRKTKQPSQT